jgi:hypothetical protein
MAISFLSQLEQKTKLDGKRTWSYTLPFGFSPAVNSFTAGFNVYPEDGSEVRLSTSSEQTNTTLSEGFAMEGYIYLSSSPQLVVGESDGLLHFAAYVSPQMIQDSLGKEENSTTLKKKLNVGVIWDRSVSLEANGDSNIEALKRIHEGHNKEDQTVAYTLFTYNTFATRVLDSGNIENLVSKLEEVFYDGGTDLSAIDECLSFFQCSNFDYLLVFTDGLDNIGHAKRLPQAIMESSVPIHVISPATGNINADLLKSIAARTGGVFENSSKVSEVVDNIIGKTSTTVISKLEIENIAEGTPLIFLSFPFQFFFWSVSPSVLLLSFLIYFSSRWHGRAFLR